MSDEASPAWTSLRTLLAPTFPQLQEFEAGGALAMELGYPLVLVSRTARWLLVPASCCMVMADWTLAIEGKELFKIDPLK